MNKISKLVKFCTLFVALSFFSATTSFGQTTEKNVTIIELAQTPGEFTTQELNLSAGKYQFRIVNQNVDHELGFVIQKAEDKGKDVMKNHLENSFASKTVKKGEAAYTGIIDLKKGQYVYICPLNPTPHYNINVK